MSTPRTWVRVGRMTLLTGALALSLAPLAAAPAMAVTPLTTADPAEAAAGWLAGKVDAGTLTPSSLADAILAFAATGVGHDAADDALAQLATKVDSYIAAGASQAGALGKVLLAVDAAGGDINAFAGHDLEAELRALVVADGDDAGHIGQAQVFEQAVAILALAATGDPLPDNVGAWLVARQCLPDGDFTYAGSCPPDPYYAPDPDTTAIVIQALQAAGEDAALADARAWLKLMQLSDGSFESFGTPNSSSTAAAAQAFRVVGDVAEADQALAWASSLQFGCGAGAGLIGAIPWSAGGTSFLEMSTTQAMLGAATTTRLDQLSLTGAASIAPTLACPGAPTDVEAAAGAGVATVNWTAPADDGGLPITAYLVRSAPGGYTCMPRSILVTSCTMAGLDDGRYTFTVLAINGAGTSPASDPSAQVKIDTTAPSINPAPTIGLRVGQQLNGVTVPVKVDWAATDALSAITGYELEGSTDGGTTWVPAATPTASAFNVGLAAGAQRHQFRVKATDAAFNTSAWKVGRVATLSLVDDASAKVTYRGSWSKSKPSSASATTLHSTSSRGASASITFTGRSIAWVAPKGSTRGKAAIYLDGVRVKTVDLRAASASRVLVYARTWSTSARHTLKIVSLGTSGHPRIDVDAFVIVK